MAVTVEQIKSWPKNEFGWHVSPQNVYVKLGDGVTLGAGYTHSEIAEYKNYIDLFALTYLKIESEVAA